MCPDLPARRVAVFISSGLTCFSCFARRTFLTILADVGVQDPSYTPPCAQTVHSRLKPGSSYSALQSPSVPRAKLEAEGCCAASLRLLPANSMCPLEVTSSGCRPAWRESRKRLWPGCWKHASDPSVALRRRAESNLRTTKRIRKVIPRHSTWLRHDWASMIYDGHSFHGPSLATLAKKYHEILNRNRRSQL